MYLESTNLILKKYEKSDIYNFFKLKSNKVVWQYSTFTPTVNIDIAIDNLNEHIEKNKITPFMFHGVFLKSSLKYIGEAGILSYNQNANRCTIGYNLLPEYWNRGYATEIVIKLLSYAFDNLKVERVEAIVMKDNIYSCKVLEKSGFMLEGVLRNFTKIENCYKDVCYYSKLSSDSCL